MSIHEIQAERAAQLDRWDHAADDTWSIGEWAALVSHFATRHVVGDLPMVDLRTIRADMVKVGAVALACIEAIDRKLRIANESPDSRTRPSRQGVCRASE